MSPVELLSDIINIHTQPLSGFLLHIFPKLFFYVDLFQTDSFHVSIMILFQLEVLQ